MRNQSVKYPIRVQKKQVIDEIKESRYTANSDMFCENCGNYIKNYDYYANSRYCECEIPIYGYTEEYRNNNRRCERTAIVVNFFSKK